MEHELITLLIVFAILGLIDALYLIIKRVKKSDLVCTIGNDCNKVVESKYSKIFFVKNDVLGLIYYILIIISALYLVFVSVNILFLMKIFSAIALLASMSLFYIQAKIIKEYCFYCIISAIINTIIFLLIFMIRF